jgi:hypothetical protein
MSETNNRATGLLAGIPGPLGVIAAVFVLLGIWGAPRSPSSRPGDAARPNLSQSGVVEDSVAAGATDKDAGRAVRVLKDYFYAGAAPNSSISYLDFLIPRGSGKAVGPEESALRAACTEALRIDCLVATIPDPIDSQFQMTYDRHLEAMTRALESAGYVLDSFSLPWSSPLLPPKDRVRHDKVSADRYGCILLRRGVTGVQSTTGDVNELFLLLLVGETITAGVDRVAFSEALDVAAEVESARTSISHCPPSPLSMRIHLLGPTYSGTASSIRRGVNEWWEHFSQSHHVEAFRCNVTIVSGTATSQSNRDILNFCNPTSGLASTFQATVIPDDFALSNIVDYLVNERGIPLEKIVLLREGNTSYGSAFGGSNTGTKTAERGNDTPANATSWLDSRGATLKTPQSIPYPVGLSRVRSEYQKQSLLASDMRNAPVPAANSRRNLDLTLEQPPYAIDLLPVYSEATTAANDVTLEHIMRSIVREDMRAVGLMGTDVRDKLFLAQHVRRLAPDVLLFTLHSDVLFTHAEYVKSMEGMVCAATYPLFSGTQRWTSAVPSRSGPPLQFQTDSCQGIYNATLLLIANDACRPKRPNLLDYRPPLSQEAQSRAASGCSPALWITMLGETCLWPLKVIPYQQGALRPNRDHTPEDDNHNDVGPKSATSTGCREGTERDGDAIRSIDKRKRNRLPYVKPAQQNVDLSGGYAIAAPSYVPPALVSLVCLAIAVAYFVLNLPQRRPPRWRSILRLWLNRAVPWLRVSDTALFTDPNPPTTGRRSGSGSHMPGGGNAKSRLFALVLFCGLGALLLTSTTPTIAWWMLIADESICRATHGWSFVAQVIVVLMMLTAFLGVMSSMVDTVTRSSSTLRPVRATRNPIARVVIVLMEVAVLAVGVVVVRAFWSAVDLLFFINRAGAWESGVTPLIPMVALFTAIVVWAVCHLRWRYLLNAFPFPDRSTDEDPAQDWIKSVICRTSELGKWLRCFRPWPVSIGDWLLILATLAGSVYVFLFRWSGTAEGKAFDWVFVLCAWATVAFILMLFGRLTAVCSQFSRLLRRLGQHAICPAFSRIEDLMGAKSAVQMFASTPYPGDLERPVRCLRRLADTRVALSPEWSYRIWPEGSQFATEVERMFLLLDDCGRYSVRQKQSFMRSITGRLFDITHDQIVARLGELWASRCFTGKRTEEISGQESQENQDKVSKWRRDAETFLAMQYVHLIRITFLHIKNMMTCLVVMVLCLLACCDAYPFQQQPLMLGMCFILVLWIAVRVIFFIVTFSRDEVLSRLGGSEVNRFNLDRSTVMPLITYVFLPIASVLLIRFPSLGTILFGWLETLNQGSKF